MQLTGSFLTIINFFIAKEMSITTKMNLCWFLTMNFLCFMIETHMKNVYKAKHCNCWKKFLKCSFKLMGLMVPKVRCLVCRVPECCLQHQLLPNFQPTFHIALNRVMLIWLRCLWALKWNKLIIACSQCTPPVKARLISIFKMRWFHGELEFELTIKI